MLPSVTHHFDQVGMVACDKELHDVVIGREALLTVFPHSVEVLGTRMGRGGETLKDNPLYVV